MGLRAIISNNRLVSRFKNGRVHSTPNHSRGSISNNHSNACTCRDCKENRRRDRNTACLAICPLIGIMACVGLVS